MNDIAHIYLKSGGFTIVDLDLHDWLSRWTWTESPEGYAYRYERISKSPRKYRKVYLHVLINGTPTDHKTDHKNGCRLDNRRSNLRTATNLQNSANQTKKRFRNGKASSKFKGVYFNKREQKWIAGGSVNRKTVRFGSFETEREAATCYNQKARELYGEFAGLNQLN
jgi:hypothetical protein